MLVSGTLDLKAFILISTALVLLFTNDKSELGLGKLSYYNRIEIEEQGEMCVILKSLCLSKTEY